MVDFNVIDALNSVNWANVVAGVPGVSDLIALGKAISVAVLVYVIFLIIRSVTQILYSLRFKKVVKDVAEINNKMDILIAKISGKNIESKAKKK